LKHPLLGYRGIWEDDVTYIIGRVVEVRKWMQLNGTYIFKGFINIEY
jgi:hypothetical protein